VAFNKIQAEFNVSRQHQTFRLPFISKYNINSYKCWYSK